MGALPPNAVERLVAFLQSVPLTDRIAELEHRLDGCSVENASTVAAAAGVDSELLQASIVVRNQLGRVSDVIHALAIVLALPRILEPGERIIRRPSLAAGNDPSRPFDLETDLRVAEFKLARWTGKDATRKRQTFRNLVHLAGGSSERIPQLYVVGQRPIRFLKSSSSTARWAYEGASTTGEREAFAERYGTLEIPIGLFKRDHAPHVEVIDLTDLAPELFSLLADSA